MRLSQIHEALTERCALILYAYRKFCAAAAAPTQVRVSADSVIPIDAYDRVLVF